MKLQRGMSKEITRETLELCVDKIFGKERLFVVGNQRETISLKKTKDKYQLYMNTNKCKVEDIVSRGQSPQDTVLKGERIMRDEEWRHIDECEYCVGKGYRQADEAEALDNQAFDISMQIIRGLGTLTEEELDALRKKRDDLWHKASDLRHV